MSDVASPAAESLTQRLAVGRLSGAGLLDGGALRRAHERFAPSGRMHLLNRLQRRVATAAAGSERLPFVRVDRSADGDVHEPGIAGDGAATRIAPAERAMPAGVAMRGATSVAGGGIAPLAPAISRMPAIVARRITETPGLAAASSLTPTLLMRSAASQETSNQPRTLTTSADARTTTQRIAEHGTAAGAAANTESAVSHAAGAFAPHVNARTVGAPPPAGRAPISGIVRAHAPTLFRMADTLARARATRSPSDANTESSSIASDRSPANPSTRPRPLAGTSLLEPAPTSVPLTLRTVDRTARAMAGAPLPTVAASSRVPTPSPRLVLRKPLVVVAAPAHSQAPSIAPSIATSPATSPATVVARARDAYGPAAHPGDSRAHDWDIDWIAEQVGRRLARRLEIERERTGARSWRQAN